MQLLIKLFRFTSYDNGNAYSDPGALVDPSALRRELVSIAYETNVLGFKGKVLFHRVY